MCAIAISLIQAVRNASDLNAMSVPVRYREIGDFHEYYSGVRKAPYLTIFVGGNHEASNYLFELYYGGWVAPNIYYMGAANVVRCGPIRIAGISGIWKGYNYQKTHHERLPYNQDDVKSAYHVREVDVRKLLQIRTQVDVGISHDWPRGVEWDGNWKALFSMKGHFEEDARNGTLGSVAARYVLERLRPFHWFSAHLHCKFTATIKHAQGTAPSDVAQVESSSAIAERASNADEIDVDMDDGPSSTLANDQPEPATNTDEIDLDLDGEDGEAKGNIQVESVSAVVADASNDSPAVEAAVPEDLRNQLPESFKQVKRKRSSTPVILPTDIANTATDFLALDKCLPNRKFLELLEIQAQAQYEEESQQRPYKLCFDEEWLAITRVFASDQQFGVPAAKPVPDEGEGFYRPLVDAQELWVKENIVSKGLMEIPENFEQTAPIYDSSVGIDTPEQPKEYTNNQTAAFCEMLDIPNPFDISEEARQERIDRGPASSSHGPNRGGRGGFGRGGNRGGGRGRSRGRGRGGRW